MQVLVDWVKAGLIAAVIVVPLCVVAKMFGIL